MYLYHEVPPGVAWDSPENRLIVASGPFGGTHIMGSGTISVVTKGTMTNGATSSQANGFMGACMKFAGYDAVIFQGQRTGGSVRGGELPPGVRDQARPLLGLPDQAPAPREGHLGTLRRNHRRGAEIRAVGRLGIGDRQRRRRRGRLAKQPDRSIGSRNNESGWVVARTMECYQKGLIAKQHLGGLDLTRGNVEATRRLLGSIARDIWPG